jgi:hypothetical protein
MLSCGWQTSDRFPGFFRGIFCKTPACSFCNQKMKCSTASVVAFASSIQGLKSASSMWNFSKILEEVDFSQYVTKLLDDLA